MTKTNGTSTNKEDDQESNELKSSCTLLSSSFYTYNIAFCTRDVAN